MSEAKVGASGVLVLTLLLAGSSYGQEGSAAGPPPAKAAQGRQAVDPEKIDTFIKAARFGQLSTVQLLLIEGVPVNSRDKLGETALIAAANGGYADVVGALLDAGADVSGSNHEGRTALMAAAIRGDAVIIERLLSAKADVNITDSKGETALFDAVRYGYPQAVRLLLANGADPNLHNNLPASVGEAGYTPLMYAAGHGLSGANENWLAIVRELLNKGADPNMRNARGDSAVSIAEKAGFQDIVAVLLQHGGKQVLTYSGLGLNDALIVAARNGDAVKTREILDLGAEPNAETSGGVVPLLAAAVGGNVDVVRTLVERGALVNTVPNGLREFAFRGAKLPRGQEELARAASRGDTALMLASYLGHAPVVEYLLSKGADPVYQNRNGDAPLSVAAEQGHAEVVALLLKRRVDPNEGRTDETPPVVFEVAASTLEHNPPLVKAAQGGHAEAARLLLEAGARPDTRGFAGKTALFWAVERGHEGVVQVLLAHGATLDIKDDAGLTPLMEAAKNGRLAVVRMLLNRDAEVDAREGADITAGTVRGPGTTALMFAANGGHKEIVQVLMAAGADISLRNNSGQTAVDMAAKNGYEDIVGLLRGS